MQFLLDKGDVKNLTLRQTEEISQKLFQYFQIGLTLPNSMFWVNLRPDSFDNIIDPYLEKTDLGKVLLEADLQLKKDLARFTNPDTAEGRQYWNKLYEKAELIFGSEDIEIPTLTRPWIVPGEIIIRESTEGAFIYKATLKVMLEQDYLQDSPFYAFSDPRMKEINQYSSELIRQRILSKLTREVNASKRYAALRQVYYSLVLAQWFKSKNKYNTGSSIDQKDLTGLTSKEQWSKATYFNLYRKSFSEGEYKKEETLYSQNGSTIKQYFSGGVQLHRGSFAVIQAYSSQNPTSAGQFLELKMPLGSNGGIFSDNTAQQSARQDGGVRQQEGGSKEARIPIIDINNGGLLVHGVQGGAFVLTRQKSWERFKSIWEGGLKTSDQLGAEGKGYMGRIYNAAPLLQDKTDRISLSKTRGRYDRSSTAGGSGGYGWGAGPRNPFSFTIIINPDYVKERKADFKRKSLIDNALTAFDSSDEVQTKKTIPRKEGFIGLIVHPENAEMVIDWMLELTKDDPDERLPVYLYDGQVIFDPSSKDGTPVVAAGGRLWADGGAEENDLGGIDLRALPVVGQPSQIPDMAPQVMQQLQLFAARSMITDLDKEWLDIQQQIHTATIPFVRIKEFYAVCCRRRDDKYQQKVISCIIDLMRYEEEAAVSTSTEIRDLLEYLG